ncbi:hypothetical protein ABIB06_007076 [Bradyrhizobium sp. LB8.2]
MVSGERQYWVGMACHLCFLFVEGHNTIRKVGSAD